LDRPRTCARRSDDTAVDQTDAPYVPIDDSAVENALRPAAVGRKSYLHLGSERGGRTAAVLMSLVQSGRRLGTAPHAYLHDVLNRVSTHPASRVDDLLPDRWVLPGR
jgi:transposase